MSRPYTLKWFHTSFCIHFLVGGCSPTPSKKSEPKLESSPIFLVNIKSIRVAITQISHFWNSRSLVSGTSILDHCPARGISWHSDALSVRVWPNRTAQMRRRPRSHQGSTFSIQVSWKALVSETRKMSDKFRQKPSRRIFLVSMRKQSKSWFHQTLQNEANPARPLR